MPRLPVWLLPCIVLCAATSLAADTFAPPMIIAPRLASPPQSAEEVLGKAASIAGFLTPDGRREPSQQTRASFAYDDSALYIAFECADEDTDSLTAQYLDHDGHVYRDDSVEVFISTRPESGVYYQFAANVAGARYEERCRPPAVGAWNGPWDVKIEKKSGYWTALVTLPFATFDVPPPEPGDTWTANLARREATRTERSCWSPVGIDYHNIDTFGSIIFGETNSPSANADPLLLSLPGEYVATVRVDTRSGKPAAVRTEIVLDDRVISSADYDMRGPTDSWEMRFPYSFDGRHRVCARIYDARSQMLLARTAQVLVETPDYRSRLERYARIVADLDPHSPELKSRVTSVANRISAARALDLDMRNTASSWQKLGEAADAVKADVAALRYADADVGGRGYAVGTESVLRKVLRDELFEGALETTARVSAARNEFEAVQVVLLAYDKALQDVAVTVSDLRGPDGAALPSDSVRVDAIDFVKTRKPSYEVDYVGWIPDPLMGPEPFDVEAGKLRPVWVTVHPPASAKAGLYTGEVVIRPANAPEARLPIEVRVWDFTLPKETHLKTAFALFENELNAFYGDFSHSDLLRYYDFLLEHRVNPTNIYSKRPVPDMSDMPFCVERGLNAFTMVYTHNKSDEDRAELAAMIRENEKYLRERGWWNKAYIYGFDEIKPDLYHELRSMYRWVREEFPDLPRMCTVIPNSGLQGYIDIWVPLTANYIREDAEAAVSRGEQVWWYVCCVPTHPYANWFIDYPAIDARILPWMNWKYKIPGLLYYALNLWESNRSVTDNKDALPPEDPEVADAIKSGKRWPEIPWNTYSFRNFNGDGMLIYPGPDRKPASSIRFELLRDGIEDYEYFYLLNELVERATLDGKNDETLQRARKALAVRDEVVKTVTVYTSDPETLIRAREELAELIAALGAGRNN